MYRTTYDSPLGRLLITEKEDRIVRINWGDGPSDRTALLEEACRQIDAYFASKLRQFDLPVRATGDSFQDAVNSAMSAIPFGETRTYGDIAKQVGSAPQPIGQACGNNCVSIVIPCHRVVGADGLGGFSAPGGIETKVALLRHEGAYGLLI
ncbi:MAG: methylated-DNA--[protein]-cysteine S-methyltransferase [Pseudomonadota bacterium]